MRRVRRDARDEVELTALSASNQAPCRLQTHGTPGVVMTDHRSVSAESDSDAAVRCTPLPSWVKHESWPQEPEELPVDCADYGLLRVLYDAQISLLQPG